MLPKLYELVGNKGAIIKLAGVSGAISVLLKIYYTNQNAMRPVEDERDYKVDLNHIFETSNRVHFTHSLALLAVPLVKYPLFVRLLLFNLVFRYSLLLFFVYKNIRLEH